MLQWYWKTYGKERRYVMKWLRCVACFNLLPSILVVVAAAAATVLVEAAVSAVAETVVIIMMIIMILVMFLHLLERI